MRLLRDHGVRAALLAAVLFGASAPIAKLLLGGVSPWLLAGLLYCGSGLGLGLLRIGRRRPGGLLGRREGLALAGSIAAGGVVAPVLLLVGLTGLPASGGSLLLNTEAVATTVLARLVFREAVGRRIAVGMLAIVAGAALLSVPDGVAIGSPLPALAVVGACVCWGLDNNLTRIAALEDASRLAMVKGLVAGPVNLLLALSLGAALPDPLHLGAALATGFLGYGVSLALFIVGMRHVGAARAGAYFSVAPFFGALLAVLLGASVTPALIAAAALMGIGVWLHLTERHEHEHTHEAVVHDHWHRHDDGHHDHAHADPVAAGTWHRHEHAHERTTHTHPHFPDAQHRHHHG